MVDPLEWPTLPEKGSRRFTAETGHSTYSGGPRSMLTDRGKPGEIRPQALHEDPEGFFAFFRQEVNFFALLIALVVRLTVARSRRFAPQALNEASKRLKDVCGRIMTSVSTIASPSLTLTYCYCWYFFLRFWRLWTCKFLA